MSKFNVFIVLTIAIFQVAISSANSITNAISNHASLEEKAQKKSIFMNRTGGFIIAPGKGPQILIVDYRSLKDNAPNHVIEVINNTYRIPITNFVVANTKEGTPLERVKKFSVNRNFLMVIGIFSDEGETSMSVYPEDRIAILNSQRITLGCISKEDAQIRMIKEIWRAIGFIAGSGYATHNKSAMQPIASPIELDSFDYQVLQSSEIIRMQPMLYKYKVKLGRRTTYLQAVKEGWAPAPTNDIQRAVWDKVKADMAAEKK